MRSLFCVVLCASVVSGGTVSITDSRPIEVDAGFLGVMFPPSRLVSRTPDPLGTVSQTHIYDDDPLDGHQTVGAEWSVSVAPFVAVWEDEVMIQPAAFPNPAVFETRTVTQTIEVLQWPVYSGNATFQNVVIGPDDFLFSATIRGDDGLPVRAQSVIRHTLVGPETTTVDIITKHPLLSTFPTTRYKDGEWSQSCCYWGEFGSISIGQTIHDGVQIGEILYSQATPVLPVNVPEPTANCLALLLGTIHTYCRWRRGPRRVSRRADSPQPSG